MEIEFLNLKNRGSKYKATVNATGKLNFSPDCKDLINFEEQKYFKIGVDPKSKKTIYLVSSEITEESVLKINKTGKAFYLNFSEVLKEIKLDTIKDTITFEISKSEIKYEGKEYLILNKVETRKRKSKTVSKGVNKKESSNNLTEQM